MTACDDEGTSCVDLNCPDHEVCMMVDGAATCVCDSGYTGDGCDECESGYTMNSDGDCVTSETCADVTCSGRATCDDSSGTAICVCDAGWTGTDCDECATGYVMEAGECVLVVSCDDGDPCGGHGECDDSGDEVVCNCYDGYEGDFCDSCAPGYHEDDAGDCVADEVCGTNTCNGHGDCDDSSGAPVCTCEEGYAGDRCDTCDDGYHLDGDLCVSDTCPPDACSGHGECSVVAGEAVCTCDEGYEGDVCDECAEGFEENRITGLCEVPCDEGRSWIRCGDECVRGDTAENCGGCDIACEGDAWCNIGAGGYSCICWYDTCPDGSCADLMRNDDNCGECSNECDTEAGETCYFGTCQESSTECDEWCEEEWGMCCPGGYCLWYEEAYTDPENCGGCGIECEADEICAIGRCMSSTWTCDEPCREGSICCDSPWGGRCLDGWSFGWDPDNCGGCNIECAAGERCDDGRCICRAPSIRCGDSCLDPRFDNANCGECGNVCDLAAGERCAFGVCEPGESECSGCSDEQLCCEDSASPGEYECVSVDEMMWNPEHCGGCEPCIEGEECVEGFCQCWGEYTDYCGDPPVCTDLWSYENCGTCGNACEGDEVCEWEEWPFAPDCMCFYDTCDGECADLMRNEDHCGECDTICAAGELCLAGDCVSATSEDCGDCGDDALCCEEPDGDARCIDQWEFMRSDEHCGECGNQCSDGEICDRGECVVPPGDTCDNPIEAWWETESNLCDFSDTVDVDTGDLCADADGGAEVFFEMTVWEGGEHNLWFGMEEGSNATLFVYRSDSEDGCSFDEPLACVENWGEATLDLVEGETIYIVVMAAGDECNWFYFELW